MGAIELQIRMIDVLNQGIVIARDGARNGHVVTERSQLYENLERDLILYLRKMLTLKDEA